MQGNADLQLPPQITSDVFGQVGNPVVATLTVAATGDLLRHLDQLVSQYQCERGQFVSGSLRTKILLLGLTMLGLVLEALLIFRPTLMYTKEIFLRLLASQPVLQRQQVELVHICAARTADFALQLQSICQRELAQDCIKQGALHADVGSCLRFANKRVRAGVRPSRLRGVGVRMQFYVGE